jgi:exosortase
MSTSSQTAQQSDSSGSYNGSWVKPLLPYIIAIVAQLPMLSLYFRNLWTRPHYRFFPFAILAVVVIAWSRWPSEERMPYFRSWWSNLLMLMGLGAGLFGLLFMEPAFAALSVFLLVASMLAMVVDPETGKGMWTVSLPLFVAMLLPFGWDTALITKLQRVSAVFTSRILDLIGYGHYMPGTTIEIPGKGSYGIEEACSGVQSFFTLLFVAIVFIVWNRRPLFRSVLLIVAAVFWAIFMNTVRILAIPVVDRTLGVDLAHGISHDILGWSVMTLGILLLFSTDQFLLFMFGPVETETGRSGPMGNFITEIWNGLIAGDVTDEAKKKRRGRKPVSTFGKGLMWTTAVIMVVCGVLQLNDVRRSYSEASKLKVRFFDTNVVLPYEEADLPKELDGWTLVGYKAQDRRGGSDLGQRSDSWNYQNSRYLVDVSMDQTFPGWHELTTCYVNQGWILTERKKENIEVEIDGQKVNWPYIEARLEKKTGEHGYLLFSHFDAFGMPVDAPAEWGTVNSFLIRAKNRLPYRIRASLFRAEAYQVQVFVPSFGEIDDDTKREITDHYLKIRQLMLERYESRRQSTESDTASP